MLPGKDAQRVLAAEIYQPERSLRGQTERVQVFYREEPQHKQEAGPERRYPGCSWMEQTITASQIIEGEWDSSSTRSSESSTDGLTAKVGTYQASTGFADGLNYCRLTGGHRPMTWEKLDLILKMPGYPSLWKTRSMFQSG